MAPLPTPAADLLPVQRRATLVYRLARIVMLPLFHALFVFHVKGQRNIPRGRGFVLIANHLNWLDSFALLASFPPQPRVHFLGDPTGLARNRFQWAFVRRVGGYIPVDKRGSGPTLYHHVDRCLGVGGIVALYPEGHYGEAEGALGEFKKGFAHFAVHNHVAVLPVALSGTRDLWLRKKILVLIGPPIEPGALTVDEMLVEGRRQLRELLPAYRERSGPKLLRRWLTDLL